MNQKELIEKIAQGYNEIAKIATNPEVEPAVRSFYNGKAEGYLLILNDLRNLDDTFSEGVLYALDYLSDLYEGVEMTSIAIEYGYKKENA